MPKSTFSKRANHYEKEAQVQDKYAKVLIDESLRLTPHEYIKVADLGCGTGTVCREILRRRSNCLINNYDLSPEMLKVASSRCESTNAQYIQGSIPEDGDYDLIMSNFALQWYDDLGKSLKKCIEQLKINGILSVIFPVEGSFETLKEAFEAVGEKSAFFQFPKIKDIKKSITKTDVILEEVFEEEQKFKNTLEFFKHIHSIGANQAEKNLSSTKLKKLIHYHDELFADKIIVKYKILKIILKRVV